MSEPATAVSPPPPTASNPPPPTASKMFTELKVSGHLMTFEPGLYCIVQTPGARRPEDGSGLPGVRISLPPSPLQPGVVAISSFRPDGWMSGNADAMLIRVANGPAQVLVTIYQATAGADTAPRLQVLRLADESAAAQPGPALNVAAAAPGAAVAGAPTGSIPELVAHIQTRGDVGAALGSWVGDKGSKRWIEGFIVLPHPPIAPGDLEYQAVLGRGWLSPWVEGGQLCGSRGMALPILGMRLRVRGETARAYDVSYSATFIDGTAIGPVAAGEACEAETLAPMEAFQVVFAPRDKETESTTDAAPATDLPAAVSAQPSPRGIRGKTAVPKRSR